MINMNYYWGKKIGSQWIFVATKGFTIDEYEIRMCV